MIRDTKTSLDKRLDKQNLILYGIIAMGLIAAPPHVKELVTFIGKILNP